MHICAYRARAYISLINLDEYSYTNEACIKLPLITVDPASMNINYIQMKAIEISQWTTGTYNITPRSYQVCVCDGLFIYVHGLQAESHPSCRAGCHVQMKWNQNGFAWSEGLKTIS